MRLSVSHKPILITIWLLSTAPSAQAGVPVPFTDLAGPEVWVDGPEAVSPVGGKVWGDVAVDNRGRRIHVFGASVEIYLRRYDAQGNPLEDPRLVNTTTNDLQERPRVAVSADGSFLVVWDHREGNRFVRSQAYDADGNTVGPEQLVSTLDIGTSAFYTRADVAALRTADGSPGGYVVVWFSFNSVGSDTGTTIQGCLVGTDGVPGSQFQVNSDDAPGQNYPSVTELADGGFLAVWSQTTADQVWGRRFNSAAGPVGNDFQISTEYETGTYETDAAIGLNGTVAVVWADEDDPSMPAGNAREIRARLYDYDLVPLGADFRVNNLLDTDQRDPRVADFGPAGFLVVWPSPVASGDDMQDSIEARVMTGPDEFDADGNGIDDPQVQLNIWDNNHTQRYPSTHGWYGRLATDWQSESFDDIVFNGGFYITRDIEYCVFCDDFDWFHLGGSGNLWRWSLVNSGAP